MTDQPRRIRRPWIWRDRPANTVNVARPTKYGNPFRHPDDPLLAVAEYTAWLATPDALPVRVGRRLYRQPSPADIKALHGKNQACYCPLNQPCHADVLLELANA
jgi:Domain of unknown function (DUF4326)